MCDSKVFQWKSDEDVCQCCTSTDKSTYVEEECVSLVDGGCTRDGSKFDKNTIAEPDANTWSVYRALRPNACGSGYSLTFKRRNGRCKSDSVQQMIMTEDSSLDDCA